MRILHHDDTLLAVDKPSGMLTHRGWGRDGEVAVQTARDLIGRRVHPAHRLDRATSGVLLFALSADVARSLELAFAERRIAKRYLALARGLAPESLVVDHPLARTEDPGPPGERQRDEAITEIRRLAVSRRAFEVRGRPTRYSFIEACPRTGRTHQIRRHLKHLSHPLVGDVRYGKGEHNRFFREHFGFHRLALHAERLRLVHPVTGEALEIVAPLPEDMAALLEALDMEWEDGGNFAPAPPV